MVESSESSSGMCQRISVIYLYELTALAREIDEETSWRQTVTRCSLD